MNLFRRITLFVLTIFVIGIFTYACATMESNRTPTVSISQYGFESDKVKAIEKADITISLEPIRLNNIYDYPNLFGFELQDFPQYSDNYQLQRSFPVGPQGLRWSYPFVSPDLSEQLQLYYVTIKNNTDHILRMEDSRVYMIPEGEEPVRAITEFGELVNKAERFERMERRNFESQPLPGEYPTGIYQAFLDSKRQHYDLINSLGEEILPGYSHEGLIVFPVLPIREKAAKISFFDITTKTDAAGTPVEKTQFDFPLQKKDINLWYDSDQKKWKEGSPPQES